MTRRHRSAHLVSSILRKDGICWTACWRRATRRVVGGPYAVGWRDRYHTPTVTLNTHREGGSSVNEKGSDAQNVGILLYDGVQVTDFTGPYDVFVLARP